MGHELSLSVVDGKAEMFYYGETPLHGLGTKVDKALTAIEAIQAARLYWEVNKRTLYYYPFPDFFTVEDLVKAPVYANVRGDNGALLGMVSKDYKVIQNHEAFFFLDAVVNSTEAKYHSAGALFGGKIIWLLMKLPDFIKVKSVDMADKYLLLVNGFDGKMKLRVMFTPIRVVCYDTLKLAIKGMVGKCFTFNHTGDIMEKVGKARKVLGIACGRQEE